MIYLCSLPIWNGVLPLYAYWKFDDFSWGDTRKAEGEDTKKKGGGHGEVEGEFDSSRITMKRWVDFEQERRSNAESSTVRGRQEESVQGPPSAWNKAVPGTRRSRSSHDFLSDY